MAISIAGAFLVALAASKARLGFGPFGDILLALGASALLAASYAAVASLVVRGVRRFAALPTAVIVGLVVAIPGILTRLMGVWVVRPVGLLVLGIVGLWGAVIGDVLARALGRPQSRHPKRRVAIAVTVSALAYFAIAHEPGDDPQGAREATRRDVASMLPGDTRAVREFRYGTGSDKRRPALAEGLALRTAAVDLRQALPAMQGWRERIHRQYWGFSLAEAPVNGLVWLPEGDGPFPVALLLHGVGTSEQADEGLEYLAQELAARGIAAVAPDLNFLSGPWVGGRDGVIAARVLLALHHLSTVGQLTRDGESPAVGRLDLSRVALLGHSRGGEAAAAAAMLASLTRRPELPDVALDERLQIRAVAALSPTDGLYHPAGQPVTLEEVSYLLLRGTHDADTPPQAGAAQFHRTLLNAGSARFKAAVVLAGADHAQFNTSAGSDDLGPPLSLLLSRDGRLAAATQRAVTAATVVAFLAEALAPEGGDGGRFYARLDTIRAVSGVSLVRRVVDGRATPIATFDEDVDPATATLDGARITARGLRVWQEGRDPFAEDSYVRLGWGMSASGTSPWYDIQLPVAKQPRASAIVFGVASLGGDVSFTLELQDGSGRRARVPVTVSEDGEYTRRTRRWRSLLLDAAVVPTLPPSQQTVIVPVERLQQEVPGFDAMTLRSLRLNFDGSPEGAILLDDVSYRFESGPARR